ncbi:Zn(II)2Cys6 transcription factor [Aspergillus ibericus CBS 121593]|uniref:C6 transcription factor n=1 Tax=Aspergillus ibericus CBS 121593 TaxID=1448316 RepID=A0A395GW39_9EURO|nr:C6 transcription factor [Aspergillus ibericus CBS 121593]RAK99642.1 C6 transcription factor [Aspergillus ibericus CBS 121593]
MVDQKPSPLACVPCRRRHLKCDAQMPVCTRCYNTNNDCRYVRSRRGLRNRSSPDTGDLDFTSWLNGAIDIDPDFLELPDLDVSVDIHSESIPSPGYIAAVVDSEPLAHDAMIQLYYHHFHRSHPILLPRRSLASPLCQQVPAYIPHIMRYIGSHYYHHPGFSDSFHAPAYTALSAPNDEFKVQGLLLLSIIEHSYGAEEKARKLLHEAIQLACRLGMNSTSFARAHSRGSPILEESWRRTYWELVVVEGIMSAIGGGGIMSSPKWINHDMQLPCDENAYNSEQTLQQPPSLSTLPDPDTHHISSFTHRILATQNLRAVLQITQSLDPDTEFQTETLDARLATSLMRLPSSLPDHDTSTVDEMIFQTLMITYLSRIYLHHPHSTIRLSAYHATTISTSAILPPSTSCTRFHTQPNPHYPQHQQPRPHNTSTHTQKLLRAADLLSNLATLPSSVISRTPFFTCGLAIAVVVHVAALVERGSPLLRSAAESSSGGRERERDKDDSLKARIELGVGALQVLGRVWPLARRVRGEMVEMYRCR